MFKIQITSKPEKSITPKARRLLRNIQNVNFNVDCGYKPGILGIEYKVMVIMKVANRDTSLKRKN